MVSDALLGFASGFAQTYSAIEGPRLARLRAAEADREIRLENNVTVFNQLFENSKIMRDVSPEDKNSLAKKMGTVFNPTTISNLAAAQGAGYDIFTTGEGMPFNVGGTGYGIANIKPKDPTEGDKARNALHRVVTSLINVTAENPEELREKRMVVFNNTPLSDMVLAREYAEGKGRQMATRFQLAGYMSLINEKRDTIGRFPDELGSYTVNESSKLAMDILKKAGISKDSPDAILTIVNSADVNERIMVQLLRQYQGRTSPEITKAIADDTNQINNALKNMMDAGIDQKMNPPPSGGRPVSSTQIMSTEATNHLYNTFNQDYFASEIVNALSLDPPIDRREHLERLRDRLFTAYSNRQGWLSGNEQKARDAIYDYLAEQYDLAAQEMAP